MATMPLAQKITDAALDGFPFVVDYNEDGSINTIVVHAKDLNSNPVTCTCTYLYLNGKTHISEWVLS